MTNAHSSSNMQGVRRAPMCRVAVTVSHAHMACALVSGQGAWRVGIGQGVPAFTHRLSPVMWKMLLPSVMADSSTEPMRPTCAVEMR